MTTTIQTPEVAKLCLEAKKVVKLLLDAFGGDADKACAHAREHGEAQVERVLQAIRQRASRISQRRSPANQTRANAA